jgi:hypothetical protein
MSTTTTTPAAPAASFLSVFENEFQVAATDIVTWINQAWTEVLAIEQWVDNELTTIAGWIAAHEADVNALFTTAAALVPGATPEIAVAETALAAAGAASTTLAAGLKAGTTPASTLSSAFTAVTAAATAVNAVVAKAAAPTPTPAS